MTLWYIFLSDDCSSLLHVKRILHWFEIIWGFKVNFYKSSFKGINLDKDYTSGLANMNFCRSNSFRVRYLKLPLGANPSKLSSWKPMLSTIRSKLSTWIGKMLNVAKRICLIKSIFSFLPLYYIICMFILCRRVLLMSYFLLIAIFHRVVV